MKNILLFTLIFLGNKAFAQSSGGLDISFNTDGKHTVDINGNETGQAVAIQTEGKIVTAGNNGNQVIVTRLLGNGLPDLTFSIDGETSTTIPSGSTVEVGDVAIQNDGKIVVVGTVRDVSNFAVNFWDFIIVRFLPNGNLDTSFDGDGILKVNNNFYDKYNAIKIQANGSMVVAGISNGGFFVQRRLSTGALDTSFGTNGTAAFGLQGEAKSIDIKPNNKIIIAGSQTLIVNGNAANDFAVVQLNSNGTLDTSFDTDGKVTTDISGANSYDLANDVTIDSMDRIIVSGQTYVNGLGYEVAVVRYLPNGSLDIGFGGTGKKVFTMSSTDDYATSVVVLPDDQIVVSGTTTTPAYSYTVVLPGPIFQVINVPANKDMLVLLIDSYGALNNTFSGNGKTTVSFAEGKDDFAYGMALQPDGKVVVVGSAVNGTNTDFAFFRMHTIYGFKHLENTLYASIGSLDDEGKSISVDEDGNLFVASDTYNGTNFTWEIRKYKDTGLLDNTFSGDGKVTFSSSFLPPPARVSKIFAQADGKVLVAGTSLLGGAVVFTVIRLLSNGNLDTSFDTDGKQEIYLFSGGSYCTGLKTIAGGKIVLSGNSYSTINSFVSLVRLNSDGSFDTSFDTNGTVSINVSPIFRDATDLDILGDKIFLGGRTNSPGGFFAMKFNNDGSLDNTFDSDGLVVTTFGALYGQGECIKVQADGKVVLGGVVDDKLTMIRYNSNGSLDNSFGTGGVFTYQTYGSNGGKIASILTNNDGTIVAGGTFLGQHLLIKLNSNGTPYTQFANYGSMRFNNLSYAYSKLNQIAAGPYQRFYTAGSYFNGANEDLQLSVFTQCKQPLLSLIHSPDDINSTVLDPYLAQEIQASNYILSTGNAKYEAVKSILLKPGFRSEASSVFSAQIKPTCNYSTPPLVIGNN